MATKGAMTAFVNDCPCPPGSAGSPGSCVPCAAGYASSTSGAMFCSLCEMGKVAPASGTTACDDCAPGTAQGVVGQTSCNDCSTGKFMATAGADACTDEGTVSSSPGATGGICFTGDSTVMLEDGTTKKLRDLKVNLVREKKKKSTTYLTPLLLLFLSPQRGDVIKGADRNGKISYSPVVFLPHRPNDVRLP